MVKWPTLYFRSDHDLRVVRWSPTSGSTPGMKPVWDSLSLSLSLCPYPALSVLKTKQNKKKAKQKKKENFKLKKQKSYKSLARLVMRYTKFGGGPFVIKQL